MTRRTPDSLHVPDPAIVALGIRQPWVELILQGIKTIEVRSRNTRIRGTIYLYASKKESTLPAAKVAAIRAGLKGESLPYGMLVGSVELNESRPATPQDAAAAGVPASALAGKFAWILSNPKRFDGPLPVRYLPYGVWFYPFRRSTRSSDDDPQSGLPR